MVIRYIPISLIKQAYRFMGEKDFYKAMQLINDCRDLIPLIKEYL